MKSGASSHKPCIAVVVSASARKTAIEPYLEAIMAHGGAVCVVRPGDRLNSHSLHGLLLTGGGDFGDRAYGRRARSQAERQTIRQVEPAREAYERRLLRWARRDRIPTLGICRGCQMLNVFAGGTLFPDIASWRKTSGDSRSLVHQARGKAAASFHVIFIRNDSRLQAILKGRKRIRVNSSHHQAVNRCGRKLRVAARSADGIVEAIEDSSRTFWIGVQFHPERIWQSLPMLSELFKRFIACSRDKSCCRG